jgi:TetR/AcrR family transcriptional regulator, transcriptional repressor for nem operon
MGRPRTFENDQALRAVMNVFRARGYEATSLKDLEAATSLNPGSLYNAFGSKEALFLAALDHYNQFVVRDRIARFLTGVEPIEELRAMFMSVLDEPGGTRFGCLLTNTAIESGTLSPAASAKVTQGFDLLEQAFSRQYDRAKTLGSIPDAIRSNHAAFRLLHAYQGLLVLVRFGRKRSELAGLIDGFMGDIFRGAHDD